jgi:thiosulfate oxidation carrier complex protein SoxZ
MGMTRRTFVQAAASGTLVSAGLAVGLAAPRAVRAGLPPQTYFAASPTAAIKAVLGTAESVQDGAVELNIADVVEMADVVPVSVRARLDKVDSITLVGSKNPDPIIAHYRLEPPVLPFLATRVRLAQSCEVTALVKADGALRRASREVSVSIGGCGDREPGPDDRPFSGLIPEHFLMKTAKDGDDVVVRALIQHPMLSPHNAPKTGGPAGGLYIQQVTAQLNGKTVLTGDWSPGVSRDPYLSFKIRQAAPGDIIQISWLDNAGHRGASQVTVS